MITHKIRTYPCLECAPKNTCTLDSAATGIGPILLMKAIYLYIQIEVFWVVTPWSALDPTTTVHGITTQKTSTWI